VRGREDPIQALDRTQPGLPMKKGVWHDDHDTSAMAHLSVCRTGSPAGQGRRPVLHPAPAPGIPEIPRHRRGISGDIPLHLVMDNYVRTSTERTGLMKRHRDSSAIRPTSSAAQSVETLVRRTHVEGRATGSFKQLAICRPLLPSFSKPGMTIPNPSSGPPRSNRLRRSYPAVVRRWRDQTGVHSARMRKKTNLQLFSDTTLVTARQSAGCRIGLVRLSTFSARESISTTSIAALMSERHASLARSKAHLDTVEDNLRGACGSSNRPQGAGWAIDDTRWHRHRHRA